MRILISGLILLLGMGAGVASEIACSPIRVIVPFAAGGSTDVVARIAASHLEKGLQKQVVVENRAGASGNVGAAFTAQARPDGCTLMETGGVIAMYPAVFAKLDYNPFTDLLAIGGLSTAATFLVTPADSPIKNAKDLIAASKVKTGGLSFASPGLGTPQHLVTEDIASRSGGKFVHVAYRGGAPAMTDLMTARLDFATFTSGLVLPLMNDGKIKAIGVIQDQRTKFAPSVPTLREQGVDHTDASVANMVSLFLFAPKGTPNAITTELEAVVMKMMKEKSVEEAYEKLGFETYAKTSAELAALLRSGGDAWAPIVKSLNVKLE